MIQHVKPKSGRKALRGRPEVQKLIKVIRVINSVPPDVDLPKWNPFEHLDAVKQKSWKDQIAKLNEIGLEFFKRLPMRSYKPTQEFIGPVNQDTLEGKAKMYNFLRDARETLREIAVMDKKQVNLPIQSHLRSLVSFRLNGEGKIEVSVNSILKMLLDVEVSRIRQCPICRKIFWAARKDKNCCRTKCGQVFRTRNWRENYQEKYKPQRIRKANANDARNTV